MTATTFTDSPLELMLRENPNRAKKKQRALGHDLGRPSRKRKPLRTSLSRQPGPGALMCPVCDLYTNKADASLAVRQLSSHVSKKHPNYEWTHRYCCGPLHGVPSLLPIQSFHRRGGKGDWRRWCKACDQHQRAAEIGNPNAGLVPLAKVQQLLAELAERAGGYPAAAREAGVALGAVYNIRNGKNLAVKKDVAARIIAARSRLKSARLIREAA